MKQLRIAVLALICSIAGLPLLAGGFQVNLQGVAQTGMGHTGAVLAFDASAAFFNAPQSAQTDATRSRDILLYVMKNTLPVVVGGHVVEVVAGVHEDVGALVNYAKYRRSREEGLFSNITKKKK